MLTPFEFIQSIIALAIVIFSIVAIYYGIKTLRIHYKEHGKIMSCCWITVLKLVTQLLFALIFLFILEELFIRSVNIITSPTSFGALFIRPVILLNSVTNAIYAKRSFIIDKNTGIKKILIEREKQNG